MTFILFYYFFTFWFMLTIAARDNSLDFIGRVLLTIFSPITFIITLAVAFDEKFDISM